MEVIFYEIGVCFSSECVWSTNVLDSTLGSYEKWMTHRMSHYIGSYISRKTFACIITIYIYIDIFYKVICEYTIVNNISYIIILDVKKLIQFIRSIIKSKYATI